MATVLITGANRGIGLEMARQYAARGDTVIAACRRTSPALDALGVEVVDRTVAVEVVLVWALRVEVVVLQQRGPEVLAGDRVGGLPAGLGTGPGPVLGA